MDEIKSSLEPNLELEKLHIERQRVAVEERKLLVTICAVSISLIAVILTASVGIWTQYNQSNKQMEYQLASQVMNAKNPEEAIGRERFFLDSFPGVDRRFVRSVDPTKYSHSDPVPSKIKFVELVSSRGLSPIETLCVWKILFPDDVWARGDDLKKYLAKTSTSSGRARTGCDERPASTSNVEMHAAKNSEIPGPNRRASSATPR